MTGLNFDGTDHGGPKVFFEIQISTECLLLAGEEMTSISARYSGRRPEPGTPAAP
jgi:hypothetical protein